MSHEYPISISNLTELIDWMKDQGFVAEIQAIFSIGHDYQSQTDEYKGEGIDFVEFPWGLVVYHPVNVAEVYP